MLDCRCEHSFIKENVISSESFEINKEVDTDFVKQFNINLRSGGTGENPYALFSKQQSSRLLEVSTPAVSKMNNLKPIIIDHDSQNPIPFKSHNNFQTFKTNFFQVYYKVNVKLKYNRSKSLSFEQPFTISNYNRIESMELIKWILDESRMIKSDDFVYDPKYDVFKRRNVSKMMVMRSKAEKSKFI